RSTSRARCARLPSRSCASAARAASTPAPSTGAASPPPAIGDRGTFPEPAFWGQVPPFVTRTHGEAVPKTTERETSPYGHVPEGLWIQGPAVPEPAGPRPFAFEPRTIHQR